MEFSLDGITIEALSYAEPPDLVNSEDVESQLAPLYERLKLPTGRLELMTGIHERRFWPKGTLPSVAAAKAGEQALEVSVLSKGSIDLLIHCGVCRDRLEPATASNIHRLLGLENHCQIFDLSNACLGILNGFAVASGMLRSGQVKRALVLSGENGRPLLDSTIQTLLDGDFTRNSIKPYFANLTIGGGAIAAVLSMEEPTRPGQIKLSDGVSLTDSSVNDLCQGDTSGEGLAMQTDSEALLVAGVALAQQSWSAFKRKTGWSAETPERVVTHQVGRRHQRALFEALGIPLEKDFSSFENWGNVGSVSLPMTLAQAVEKGALKTGDKAALLGIGSGLVCMMLAAEVV